jgi:hypothetical protein
MPRQAIVPARGYELISFAMGPSEIPAPIRIKHSRVFGAPRRRSWPLLSADGAARARKRRKKVQQTEAIESIIERLGRKMEILNMIGLHVKRDWKFRSSDLGKENTYAN